MKTAFIHVYTGDGKGKTTAALGLILRACGAGRRVFLAQFLKQDDTAEVRILRERFPDVTVEIFGSGQWVRGQPSDADRQAAHRGWQRVQEAVRNGKFDMIVCDELNIALHFGLVAIDEVMALADTLPEQLEWVLTGRNAPEAICRRADLVTEMRCVRHYMQSGIPARKGIDC